MTTFYLNDRLIQTGLLPGMPLVDFIRTELGEKGTKIGCREGDCGACLVLEGSLHKGQVSYQSIASCLSPLGRADGKHIVTIEGLSAGELTPIQQAICNHFATQCGFCTPGIVISLTAFCLSHSPATPERALAFIDGNLCRCTGYQSLKTVAEELALRMPLLPGGRSVEWLIREGYLPHWFAQMPQRLGLLPKLEPGPRKARVLVAGATDLMVHASDILLREQFSFFPVSCEIREEAGQLFIGAGVTSTGMIAHRVLQACFPYLPAYGRLIASTPIRNMGTLGGNLANASPIADWAIFFLARDTTVILNGPAGRRSVALDGFFLDYKKTDLAEGEWIEAIRLRRPEPGDLFHFEKVSKRRHLDIASVNSACSMRVENGKILSARLSAGGVSPVPLFLRKTSLFLEGKMPDESVISAAQAIAQQEISPISDIRGSAGYKRLLLRQLIYAHFMSFFPNKDWEKIIRAHGKR